MKTKYSQLLKVKKQAVDTIENFIAVLNTQKKEIECKLKELIDEISHINMPTNGKYQQYLAKSYTFEKLFEQKKLKKQELDDKIKELQKARENYKLALVEYEKIKYLEDLIIKKRIEKLKIDEQKLLDEMSVMTYKRREF